MALALVSFFILFPTFLLIVAALSIRGSHGKTAKGLNLPPGNMGLPVIGETIAFRKTHPCVNLGPFMEDRIKRFGKIYKTNLFSSPTIVSADAELNRFVLLNDGRLFEPSWPKSVCEILGKSSMLLLSGEMHRLMKSISVNFMGVPRLRDYFLADSERYILQALDSWKENTVFSAKEEASKVTYNLIVKNILSLNPGDETSEEIRRLFTFFMKGVVSVPLNLPGTNYRKALQSRARILRVIGRVMMDRRKKRKQGVDEIGESDLLGMVLENDFTTEEFGDLLLGLLFGGHETSSTAITLMFYFLESCPKAIEHLREEHMGIVRMKKQKGEKNITWDDYKLMNFTQDVIRETLRLGNIIKFVQRKATADIHFKGYDIPKGWSVIPVFSAAHLDESIYENSKQFDPWRWQNISVGAAKVESYMPFGQGIRNCAGLEMAKMEMALFLHFMVLRFDWEMAEPDHPITFAFPDFPKGLPIKVRKVSLS